MTEKVPILCEGKLFEMTTGLYYGYVPSQSIVERTPLLHWQGAPIPWSLYCQWASFMNWAYTEHQSEAQINMVYNEAKKLWDTVVYPQEVSGGSTDEIKTGDMTKFEQPMTEGYDMAGSMHSHAGMSAFQSSTDSRNELSRSGLHITLGSFDKEKISTDVRLVFRKHQYEECCLTEWLECPVDLGTMPEELRETIAEYYLGHPEKVDFPKEWANRVSKPKVTTKSYGLPAPPKQDTPLTLNATESWELSEQLTPMEDELLRIIEDEAFSLFSARSSMWKLWNLTLEVYEDQTISGEETQNLLYANLSPRETILCDFMLKNKITGTTGSQMVRTIEDAVEKLVSVA